MSSLTRCIRICSTKITKPRRKKQCPIDDQEISNVSQVPIGSRLQRACRISKVQRVVMISCQVFCASRRPKFCTLILFVESLLLHIFIAVCWCWNLTLRVLCWTSLNAVTFHLSSYQDEISRREFYGSSCIRTISILLHLMKNGKEIGEERAGDPFGLFTWGRAYRRQERGGLTRLEGHELLRHYRPLGI